VQASVTMTARPDDVRHPTSIASGDEGIATGDQGSRSAEPSVVGRWQWAGALADLAVVLLFVGIGRSTHHHSSALAGMASTSWPFVCGLAAGWVTLMVLGQPRIPLSGGVPIWLTTVALGMILRVVSGQGTAFAFVLVALAFLGAAMLGWRLAWVGVRRRLAPERS
jgi:hypothetical protein